MLLIFDQPMTHSLHRSNPKFNNSQSAILIPLLTHTRIVWYPVLCTSYQVFKGQEYHSLGYLSEKVPILSCSSLSKRYLVPGWRCGWLAIYDKQGLLGDKVSLSDILASSPGPFQRGKKGLVHTDCTWEGPGDEASDICTEFDKNACLKVVM